LPKASVPSPLVARAEPDKPLVGKPLVGKPLVGRPFTGRPLTGNPFSGKPFDVESAAMPVSTPGVSTPGASPSPPTSWLHALNPHTPIPQTKSFQYPKFMDPLQSKSGPAT